MPFSDFTFFSAMTAPFRHRVSQSAPNDDRITPSAMQTSNCLRVTAKELRV
jgi:hypothetical protein